LPLQIAASSRV